MVRKRGGFLGLTTKLPPCPSGTRPIEMAGNKKGTTQQGCIKTCPQDFKMKLGRAFSRKNPPKIISGICIEEAKNQTCVQGTGLARMMQCSCDEGYVDRGAAGCTKVGAKWIDENGKIVEGHMQAGRRTRRTRKRRTRKRRTRKRRTRKRRTRKRRTRRRRR